MHHATLKWFVIVVLFFSAVPSVSAESSDQAKSSETPTYVIQPNDVLQIFVWKDETLSRNRVLVRPDGRISLPLIQDMQAAGLNPVQLKQKIEEQLKDYLDVPNVTVIVDSIDSYQIYVMGNVAKGGPIKSSTPLTVLQALATAGGFGEFADKGGIIIIHGSERIKFNYDDFIKGKNPGQNMLLVSGDVVAVP